MVPSGSGNEGISSYEPVGGDSLFESRSTTHISSGNLTVYIQSKKIESVENTNESDFKIIHIPEILFVH